MAITLSISKNPAVIGDKVTLTASGDGTYTKYEFFNGSTSLNSGTSATFDIASVKESDAGSYTVVGTTADATETSPAVEFSVNKKTLNLTVQATTDKTSYQYGDTITAKATPSEAPPTGVTYTYEWTVNGVAKTVTGDTLTTAGNTLGSFDIIVKLKATGTDYNDFESPVSTVNVTVTEKEAKTKLSIISDKQSYQAGDSYTVKASFTDLPALNSEKDKITYTYTWSVDGTQVQGNTDTLTGTLEDAGTTKVDCKVVVSAPGYKDQTLTSTLSLVVSDIVPEGGYAYFNPLPNRDTGFIRVGWWVINEISRAGELGLDWKTAPDPLKYKDELLTLAHMFTLYPEVEVQESRNGYVWGKAQIESGYVYL